MKAGKMLLRAAGYNTFAADAVSKEMFLADMGRKEDQELEELSLETLVSDEEPCTESYVFAEEFNDFIGQGDILFITRLTNSGTISQNSGIQSYMENPFISINQLSIYLAQTLNKT
jgi:hypothetical protein